jgi:hypothetical protein
MSCIPVNLDYLLSKTWTYEMIAEDLFQLDQEECPTYTQGSEQYIEGTKNPDLIRFLLLDTVKNKLVGYLATHNLSLEYRNKVINGTFKDGELLQGITPCKDVVYLYTSGFVVSKDYRRDHANFKKLLVVFVEFITQLLNDKIEVKEITARGLTPMGRQLCEGLGMKKLLNHHEKGTIYAINFEDQEKPKYGSALYNAVQKTKAKRLLNQLLGMDEKTGLPLVKQALSNWGYKVDGI